MDSLTIIQNLQNIIGKDNNEDILNKYVAMLSDSIEDTINQQSFYQLPFPIISKIVQGVNFRRKQNPFQMIESIIVGTNREHPEESVLLLNVFQSKNIPELTKDQCISILSKVIFILPFSSFET